MGKIDVLVVDDEPSILRAITRVLASAGDFSVKTVGDPHEAVALIEQSSPRVLVTDYQMPGMNGLELLGQTRRLAPDTIRILLTGQADKTHVIEAINVGRIFRFIAKPWDNDELRAVVREGLAAHEARRDDRAMRADVEVASHVQRGFLPVRPASGEAAFVMTPHEHASGDYVDALDLPGGRTALILGDVCGHGLGAALFVTAARSLIRSGLSEGGDPVEVVERANRFLSRDMRDGRFLTLFLGVHDPERETLWYVNAGQTPPLVVLEDDVLELAGTTMPLGLDATTSYADAVEIPLRAGEVIVAYTDGLVEARDPGGEFFGTERVMRLLYEQGPKSPDLLVDCLREAVHGFAGGGGVSDDLALLAYRPHAVPVGT